MSKIDTTLNDVFKSTPLGDVRSAIGSTFYGINHRQTPMAVPINADGYGLVFFTRPATNMSTDNIRADRRFIPLLTNEPASIQRIIRCYLDPRLIYQKELGIDCPFVDNQNAFMPLLTNHVLTATGWPDPVLDTFTSKPGAYKEVYGMADSSMKVYSAYDIVASFRNMQSDPITLLLDTWANYASNAFQGIFLPYPDYLVKNEIDYQTRIYRLVLDRTKRFVQKIACTGASFPTSVNIGAAFNFDSDKPLNETTDRVESQFRTFGAVYNDPIIVHAFNRVVGIFNPAMQVARGSTLPGPSMIAVRMAELELFNCRGYPFINPDTMELLWYVSQADYSGVTTAFARHQAALNN